MPSFSCRLHFPPCYLLQLVSIQRRPGWCRSFVCAQVAASHSPNPSSPLSSPIQTAAASRHPCLAPRSRRVCDVSVKPPWKAGAPQRSGAALGVLHRAGILLILPLSLRGCSSCSPYSSVFPSLWRCPWCLAASGADTLRAGACSCSCSQHCLQRARCAGAAALCPSPFSKFSNFALLQVWCDWEQSPHGDFSACMSSEQQNLPTPPVPEALLSLAASRTGAASVGDFGSPGKAPCCRQARAVKLCFPGCDAVRGSNHGHGSQHLALLSAVVQPRFQQGSAQEPPGP